MTDAHQTLYQKAFEAMNKLHRTLGSNCLPASQAVLLEACKFWPDAAVVIGTVSWSGMPPREKMDAVAIRGFLAGGDYASYHAWIDLGGDLLDVTLAEWLGSRMPQASGPLDKTRCQELGIVLQSVITDAGEVSAFADLIDGR